MSVVPERKSKRTGRGVAYLAVAAALLVLPGLAIAGGGFSSPPAFSLKTTVTITGVPLNSFDISLVSIRRSMRTLCPIVPTKRST